MTKQAFFDNVERAAAAEKEAGAVVEINFGLPTVAVMMSDGTEYFFQGHEAEQLLDGVPAEVNEEDWILHNAQGW